MEIEFLMKHTCKEKKKPEDKNQLSLSFSESKELFEADKRTNFTKKYHGRGDKVKISPDLTGLEEWLEAIVIEVDDNRFNGVVISAKTSDGVIYFGQEKFFQKIQ